MISILAAKKGAKVWASDINPRALGNAQLNANRNRVNINFIHSDLFDEIDEKFDWIVINPPYYPRDPKSTEESAWYCGENFDFFRKMFSQLRSNLKPDAQVIMVLCQGCDLVTIDLVAQEHHWKLVEVCQKKVLGELNYIFEIRPTQPAG